MRVEAGDADKLLMSPECILILVAFQVNAIKISPFVYNLSSNPESLWMHSAYCREGHSHLFICHWSAITSEVKHGTGSYIKVLKYCLITSFFFFFFNISRLNITINQELLFPFFFLPVTSYTGTKVVLCPLSVPIFEKRLGVNSEHVVLNSCKGSEFAIKFVLTVDTKGQQKCQTVQT